MFVQGFGEVLADVMTVNPALKDLPSASSILDTSNYTFQAVTFGKDAGGFTQHSHTVSTTNYVNEDSASGASSYDSGIFTVINYASDATNGASSYIVSGTYVQFSSSYKSVPNDPSPLDRRLERKSTASTNLSTYQYASALPNLGHYPNAVLNSQLSAIWNKVGAFAPSTASDWYLYDKDKNLVTTGTVTSYFNSNGLVDKDGYLTVKNGSVQTAPVSYPDGAVLVSSAGSLDVSGGVLGLNINIEGNDALTLVSFGSVKHIGVYCLDLKELLDSGLMPPYSWDALNNNRKYKLVAKSTILDDPLTHRDAASQSGLGTHRRLTSTLLTFKFDFK